MWKSHDFIVEAPRDVAPVENKHLELAGEPPALVASCFSAWDWDSPQPQPPSKLKPQPKVSLACPSQLCPRGDVWISWSALRPGCCPHVPALWGCPISGAALCSALWAPLALALPCSCALRHGNSSSTAQWCRKALPTAEAAHKVGFVQPAVRQKSVLSNQLHTGTQYVWASL